MTLPPIIAIHGVGVHHAGQIAASVSRAFGRASIDVDVSEFDWDTYVDRSVERLRDGIALLDQTAESIANTAALPLVAGASTIDRRLQRVGDRIYHSVFSVLVAAILTLLTIGPGIHLLVLLPAVVFSAISWADFLWIATFTRVAMVAAGSVIAVMFVVEVARGIAIRSLAPVRVLLRRTSLLVLQPLILVLTIPVAARLGNGLVSGVGGMIPMIVLGSGLNLVLSPLFGNFRDVVTSIGWSVVFAIGAVVLGLMHILVRHLWVDGPLKILLDIVRYMGSPMYRSTVQAAFDDRLGALGAGADGARRVLLLAHSLGSVIALDSLINSTKWRPTDTVYLVTLGSPIRRFFIRFFPGYLFPPSVERAARDVARRVHRFYWINVHRDWDYVGTALGLGASGLGGESPTRQRTRVLASHSDYWGDVQVIDTICHALGTATPVQPDAGATRDMREHVLPVSPEWPFLSDVIAVARTVAILLIAGVVAVTAYSFLQAASTSRSELRRDLSSVAQSGTRTVAGVTYYRTVEGGGEDTQYFHHFVFQPAGQAAPLPIVRIADGTIDYRFDYDGLATFVLEDCTRAEQKRWWQVFRSVKSIPCTRPGVELVYDAGRPDSLVVPQFPPRLGRWQTVREAAGIVVAGVFFTVACTLLILHGGVRLFRLFLGLRVTEA